MTDTQNTLQKEGIFKIDYDHTDYSIPKCYYKIIAPNGTELSGECFASRKEAVNFLKTYVE